MNGRIYFENKIFVPDVGQLKFRFIQNFTTIQLQNIQIKQKYINFQSLLL